MQKLRVTYLDDEPELCEVFTDLFSDDLINIVTFSDPKTAINFIKTTPPDVLFLDYRLPNITGEKIAYDLNLSIPIILITGDLHLKPTYPFYKVIKKPLIPSEILALLNQFIQEPKSVSSF